MRWQQHAAAGAPAAGKFAAAAAAAAVGKSAAAAAAAHTHHVLALLHELVPHWRVDFHACSNLWQLRPCGR